MELTTEEISLVKSGNKEAFGRLYDSVAPDLYRLALYILGNHKDAESAVIETFIEAYQNIGCLGDLSNFKLWIMRLLSARCKRKVTKSANRKGSIDIDQCISSDSGKYSGVLEAMFRLKGAERELVVLSVLHDFAMRDIAYIMQMPNSVVRLMLHKTLYKLRKTLVKGK